MKVVGISGSSRKDGNTAIIIKTIFEELSKAGIETELIQLADIDIQPCRACFACKGKRTIPISIPSIIPTTLVSRLNAV